MTTAALDTRATVARPAWTKLLAPLAGSASSPA